MGGNAAEAVGVAPPGSRRSAHIDNAKALLIVLVVLAHSLGLLALEHGSAAAVNRTIYLFHIPAFIFVSGYLSKPDAFTRKGARALASLVFAYLLFNALDYVWSAVFKGAAIVPLNIVTRPSYALWFLLSLVWWRVLLPAFAIGESRASALASVAAAAVVSIGCGYVITDGDWMSISRVFVFLPFFVAGYRARQQHWTIPRTWWSRALAAVAFATAFVAMYAGHFISGTEVLLQRKSFLQMGDATLQAGATRLGLLAVSAVLIVAFLQLVPRRSLIFTSLGATTLSVYAWHAFTLCNIRGFGLEGLLLGSLPALVATVVAMVVLFGFGPIPRATLWVTELGRKKRGS